MRSNSAREERSSTDTRIREPMGQYSLAWSVVKATMVPEVTVSANCPVRMYPAMM